MRKIIALITASMMLAWACTDDPAPAEVKYNENDLAVLKEVYANMDVWYPKYPCDYSRPETMIDVKWENIGGEYRVVGFAPMSARYLHVKESSHEMSPRLGDLPYLRTLNYFLYSFEGKVPREIFKCPLETLAITGLSGKVSGDFYPEIYKISNTIRSLLISGIDLGIDSKELEKIFDFPNLKSVCFTSTNITGHIPARFGEQDYSELNISYNHFTSCDLDFLYTKGTFPYLRGNDIYCEVPYSITKTEKWDTIVQSVDEYEERSGKGFKVLPPEPGE